MFAQIWRDIADRAGATICVHRNWLRVVWPGHGEFIAGRALKSCPEGTQRLRIEKNDERNLALTYRAKGKAFDRMTFVF